VADRAFERGALPSRDLIVYELAQIATYGRAYRQPALQGGNAGLPSTAPAG
jgi:hypothetical protein